MFPVAIVTRAKIFFKPTQYFDSLLIIQIQLMSVLQREKNLYFYFIILHLHSKDGTVLVKNFENVYIQKSICICLQPVWIFTNNDYTVDMEPDYM